MRQGCFVFLFWGKKKEKEKKRRECKKYSAFNFPWRYRNLTQLCLESKTEQAIEI